MTHSHSFEDFSAAAQTMGYSECLVREWAPSLVIDTHTHPFDVTAIVIRGEFKLTVGEVQTTYTAGQPFALARNIPHAEHYGAEGATVWVARAN
jgi:quercetin dioxygenase-like cupin family protein